MEDEEGKHRNKKRKEKKKKKRRKKYIMNFEHLLSLLNTDNNKRTQLLDGEQINPNATQNSRTQETL